MSAKAATSYASLNWYVVPVRGKRPVGGEGWPGRATIDLDAIQSTWNGQGHDVGVLLGPRSGIIDIECDSPEAEPFLTVLFGGDMPVAPTFQSTRGKHRIFRHRDGLPAKAKIDLGRGLEIRIGNEAAQTVFPPSGGRKWLVAPRECDPPAISDEVLQRILALYRKQEIPKAAENNGRLQEGRRNTALFKLASSMRAKGLTVAGIESALLAQNVAICSPPLPDDEVRNIAASAGKYKQGGETARSGLNVVCMADVSPKPVEWFWPERIPLGKITLMAGAPGLGKTFVTTDIAARGSTGSTWPDQAANRFPGEVIFICGEDGLADTVWGRLNEANAELSKIHCVESLYMVGEDGGRSERPIRLDVDVAELDSLLTSRPNVRLMVIDPISEFEGRTDSHKNSEVRAMLKPLARLAEKHHLAIVVVTHFRKSQQAGGPAIYAAMGSLAYTAAARVAWAFIPDPDSDEHTLILPLKNNLCKRTTGLKYHIESRGAEKPGFVSWSADEVEISAEEAMAKLTRSAKPKHGSQLDRCMDWLRQRLAAGPVGSAQLQNEIEECGFSESTYRRARQKLEVRAIRNEGTGHWSTALGDQDVQARCSNSGRDEHEHLEHLGVSVHVQDSQGIQDSQDIQDVQNSLDYSGDSNLGMDYEEWAQNGAGRF